MRTAATRVLGMASLVGSLALGAPARAVEPVASSAVGPAGPVARGIAREAPGDPTVVRLENGLRVVISPGDRSPLVAMRLVYQAGAAYDEPDKSGTSQLTLASMIEATAHNPAGGYRDRLALLGALDVREVVDVDTATVAAAVPPEGVESVLWMWSDQMGFARPALSEAVLARKRAILASERRASVEGVAYGCASLAAYGALFPAPHPYGRARLATDAALGTVTVDDVARFHDRYIAPNRAVLSVVGKVDAEAALSLVRRYFADLPAAPVIEPPGGSPPRPSVTSIDMASSAEAPEVLIAWPAPPELAADDLELDVVANLLQGEAASFLGWSLLMEKKIATEVGAAHASNERGSTFTIRVVGRPGLAPDSLVAAVDAVLASLDEARVTSRLMPVVASMVRRRIVRFERSAERAASLAHDVLRVADTSFETKRLRRLSTMPATAVVRAIHRHLSPDRRVVVRVTHATEAPLCGEVVTAHAGVSP